MGNYLYFVAAAVLEIAGCYTFWLWLRLDRSVLWIAPGIMALVLFALALTRVEAQFAGRAFAAYGGIYIVASLVWLDVVERVRPLLTDYTGIALCLAGTAVILFGPGMSSS